MGGMARLGAVAIDCPDPTALAEFYAAVVGADVAFANERFAALNNEGTCLTFHKVDDYRPPSWPDPAAPKQLHLDLDLAVEDLASVARRVEELGAVRAAEQPRPEAWLVFTDPAGHPFCLSTMFAGLT